MAEIFNEGVGHGGFVATIGNKVGVIVESFQINPETSIIKQGNQIGTVTKKAGVFINRTATAEVQLPLDGNGAPLPIVEGDTLLNDPKYDLNWWVSLAPASFQVGQYHKQNLTLEQKLN